MIDFQEMASSDEGGFALRGRRGESQPVLVGVQARGRLEGVLFTLCLRQTYRNAGSRNLEVVYTFPLPARGVLLGFAAELNGRRLEGRVLPRRDAEAEYETALAGGDAPVLLEAGEGGLHTANIGNLLPGERIVLEVRIAQLLTFEHGRLRLAIPTTIAPRHGRPARGGLLPHQMPEVGLDADYPLSLAMQVMGSLASASIECPTHSHLRTQVDGGVLLELAPGSALDRDVVFTVTPKPPNTSLLIHGTDKIGAASGAGVVALAALQVPAGRARPQARVKLLVDCSGSMGGDGIFSARRALKGVASGLLEGDAVSFDRFGDQIERVMAMCTTSPAVISNLRRHIDDTEASLGGTEMAAALLALIGDGEAHGGNTSEMHPDILLITDGEIWDTRAVVTAARRTGHRVFAIGVGSSPAEDVIRRLAEATGGACEFATPGEGLEAAAPRMLARIRQGAWTDLRVDWGTAPSWQLALPSAGFGGDTVLALAGFSAGQAPAGAVRLFATAEDGRSQELGSARANDQADDHAAGQPADDELARIAAARRLPGLNAELGEKMALDYELLSEHTHCVLMHRRAYDEKPKDEAELHRVQSMLAASWGGTGSVVCESISSMVQSSRTTSVWRSVRSSAAAAVDRLSAHDVMPPAPAKAQALRGAEAPSPPTLLDIANHVIQHLAQGRPIADLPAQLATPDLHPTLVTALADLRLLLADESLVWLVVALWVSQRSGGDGNQHHASILARYAAPIGPSARARTAELLDRTLGAYATASWQTSRARRLTRQMKSV